MKPRTRSWRFPTLFVPIFALLLVVVLTACPSSTLASIETQEQQSDDDTKMTAKDSLTCDLDPSVEAKGVEEILSGLSEAETKAMPDPDMPVRHFRAEKGDASKALTQIKKTLAWRKEFQVETLRDCFAKPDVEANGPTTAAEFRSILQEEAATGKIYVRGYDKDGRAVLYMRPGKENTNDEVNNMRHLVWQLEKAIAMSAKHGHSKVTVVIDYDGFSLRQAPPLSTSKHTLEILQRHYPERLYRFYLANPPYIFRIVYGAVKPFVDPHTKQKMVFCTGKQGMATALEELGGNAAVLEECVGGTHTLTPWNAQAYLELPFDQGFEENMFETSKS